MTDERTAFEAAMHARGVLLSAFTRDRNGDYHLAAIQCGWDAWQARAAQSAVALPELPPLPDDRCVWFDTEFIEDGKTIELLSIGMVRADGATYYAEPAETDRSRASAWVAENVLPHLQGPIKPRAVIAAEIVAFAGEKPEFWAYYADYDWVALCQLYGTMMDLPQGWPMFCRDLKQLADKSPLPPQTTTEHHALADAVWTRGAWRAYGLECARSREGEADKLYHELLYAVGNKYPGESRHETALRYIQRAEQSTDGPAKAATCPTGG